MHQPILSAIVCHIEMINVGGYQRGFLLIAVNNIALTNWGQENIGRQRSFD